MNERNLEVGSIILFSFLLVAPALFVKDGLIGEGVDLYGTIWFYEWISDSVLNVRSPSHSELFFYPYGKDIFGHTGNNFVDAFLAIPFVLIFGFPTYQPVFYAAILIVNALAFRKLAAQLFSTFHARIGTTLLFLICPYVLSELIQGRPTQALLAFSVLSIHHFIRMNDRGSRTDAVLSGIFAALQGWTYWYGGYFLGFVLVGIAVSELRFDRWRLYSTALCTCFVLIAPAVIAMLIHMEQGEVPGFVETDLYFWTIPIMDPSYESSYLTGYLLHEPRGMKMFSFLSISIPTIFALFFAKRRRLWVVGLCISLAIAVGPVYMDGDTPIPLYHYIFLYRVLPFFSRLWFPYRMVSMALLFAIIGIGFALDRIGAKGKMITLLLLSAHLFEQSFSFTVPLLHKSWPVPQIYTRMMEEPAPIIELPIGYARSSILWQSQHKMPTFGGMGENLPILIPKEHRMRLKSSLYRHLKKIMLFPNTHAQPPPLLSAKKEGFRYVTLDLRVVRGIFRHFSSEIKLEKEQSLISALQLMFGNPWLVEGPLWVWDLEREVQKTEVLPNLTFGVSFDRTPFEEYLLDRNGIP